MVVSGLISAHFICSSVIIALLLDRGVCDGGKKTQFSTSHPWFPSGPPPTKPPMDEETSRALQKVLPLVTFDCKGKTGYFPDSKFNCEVFHYCKSDGTRNSFHCPKNSLFNQLSMVCEERTAFNYRLCQEGSIGGGKPLNSNKHPSPKKYISPTVSKQNQNHHHQTRPAVSVNRTGPGYVMTLEDLLGYMNSDHRTSGFYASQGVHDPSGTLVKLPPTEKEVSTITTAKPRAFSKLVNATVVRKEAPKKTSEYEDVSIEYDAIEGRKKRKHVRVGRVLDVDVSAPVLTKGKQPHSHVSARSPTENPPDTTTADEPTTTPAAAKSNTGGPSLFSADRSKAKDIRKRRRNLNRRKKLTTDATDATTTESVRVERRGPESTTVDYARSKFDRAEKEPEMSQSWLGYSHSGKVEPYTLPPLPTEENDRLETTTQRYEKEATTKFPKRKQSGRKKNQWYKTTPPPGDEYLGSRFGEKISDSDQGTNVKTKRPSEYEDFKTHSEDKSSEYTPTFTPKYRKDSKFGEERFFHFPLPSANRERLEKTPQDFFPPPRAEPRELPPPQSQPSHLYESSVERPTTESPYKTTQSYMVRPNTRVRDQQDKEHHWTLSADKRKAKRKKIQVGSTFSSHGSETTTEPPVTERPSGRRGLPKVNTEAHQHLLKLMNDFFAMSSIPKDPTERATEHYKSTESDSSAPAVERASEEDMVAGSETITDEVEELPSELLDVVDFIAGQSKEEEEEKDPEPDMSHEVIKISGPITNAHLKEILSNGDFELPKRRKKTRKESIKKIVVVPSEEKENYRDISEIAKFASTRMKPKYNFKHAPAEKPTMTVTYMNPEPTKPTVVSAKKIPIRLIYKDHTSEPTSPRVVKQPNLKVIRSRIPKPSYQVIQNGRINPTRPYNQQPHPKPRPAPQPRPQQHPKIVIQPKSVFPPHPPPLSSKNTMNFRFGFPFSAGSHPLLPHVQYRRKRSPPEEEAERRQGRSPHFMPFPRQIFPGFNPKFVPTFSPFKNMFAPMHTSGSSVSPFAFPRPQFRAPSIFNQADSRPAPVRHITQAGHQTVIVEEVPVPIHVEVPDPNMLRPVHPGNLQKNLVNPFSNNQFRSPPSPPAITTPPLVHSFQGRLPGNPNYRPMGMPSNVRPPVFNYQPSVPFSQPLPPSFTNQGQVYALGVTNKPFGPGNPAGPFQHLDVHANAYPNFPYFQGAFTTPLSDDSVPGRIMYSGYKPPNPTSGSQQPRTTSMPNRDKKETTYPRSSKPPTPRPRPTQSYYHVTKRPTTQYVSYNTPIRSVIHHTSPNGLREQTELRSIRPNYNMETTPSIDGGKKRRPYRKRRPRPRTTTVLPTVHYSRDISPTPPPPEQIPPPPSEFTSLPLKQDFTPVIHNKAVSTNIETSSLYPPAGYYGKDQLGQFFDSSSKSYKKASSPKPYEHNDVGETTSSAEIDESVTSISSEDSDQPAFGTRLRSKPQGQRRRKKTRQEVQSPTQQTEVRVRAAANPEEMKKESEQPRSRSYRKHHENRESMTPQKRPRPAQYRSRSRPSQKPEVNSYRYEDKQGFYSVPTGIQGLVDPSQVSSPTRGGNSDMFGIPHPEMDSIYSRPQGGGGAFSSSFFSVPKEVEQQQQSPLHKMDVKAIPKSAREFFSNAAKEATAQLHKAKENEEQEGSSTPATEQDGRTPTAVRKLRKPKRKIRYNPNNKSTTEATTEKSVVSSTQTTTTVETTTEPRPTYMPPTTNDVKENSVFKQRSPLLPKALPEISKSLLNGKIDIKKLNATISTSVSVSSQENKQPDEGQKRVFSSQNGGGLAVVRGGQKRKRQKQQQKVDDASDANKAKYEIAASVLDIIKATTETEKNGAGFYSSRYGLMDSSTPSPLSEAWVSNPALINIDYKRQES